MVAVVTMTVIAALIKKEGRIMHLRQRWIVILIMLSSIMTGLIFLTSCNIYSQKENYTVFAEEVDYFTDYETAQRRSMEEMTNAIKTMFSVGARTKALSDIQGIDDTAILVNGISITTREIETQSILDNSYETVPLKDTIDSMIRTKAAQSEAILLGVEPLQDDIDTFIEQTRKAFDGDVVGNEVIYSYLEGMEMTVDEYLEMMEEVSYLMSQREALWASVEPSKKYRDYEKYVDALVAKATIEILDPEIKVLFE